MVRILLADDEPLVLIGMQNMLNWADYGAELVGTARTGEVALQQIEKLQPDIVITDIKMPVKSGLDVMWECREKDAELPVFIMLTSYEEFNYARQALQAGAVDYLIKLELNQENLVAALKKAVQKVREAKGTGQQAKPVPLEGLSAFRDKFFVRLYHNLFENREQFERQKADLALEFPAGSYWAVYCKVEVAQQMDTQKQMQLYAGTMQMVQDTVRKYLPCYATSLDMRYFGLCLCGGDSGLVRVALEQSVTLVRNFFAVSLLCAVGEPVNDPFYLAESYHCARRAFVMANGQSPLVFAAGQGDEEEALFDMGRFKTELTRAFEELDADALYQTITKILERLDEQSGHFLQAMDAACNLLYMSISLLPDGEKNVEQIFAEYPDGFRHLYKLTGARQCCDWILQLRDGLWHILKKRKQSYKERIVTDVQRYIRGHLNEKLSLNEVAAAFSFSPNYLSQLFAQYTQGGFVEYVTEMRVEAAKKMLVAEDLKIYEVAQRLGFESAFYFSKVFKKVAGVSPREYQQALR